MPYLRKFVMLSEVEACGLTQRPSTPLRATMSDDRFVMLSEAEA